MSGGGSLPIPGSASRVEPKTRNHEVSDSIALGLDHRDGVYGHDEFRAFTGEHGECATRRSAGAGCEDHNVELGRISLWPVSDSQRHFVCPTNMECYHCTMEPT